MFKRLKLFVPILLFLLTSALLTVADERIWIGMRAPSFKLIELSGQSGSLQDYLGHKATVLVFWSTWSANSDRALSRLETAYGKYKTSGLSIAAINVESQTVSAEQLEKIKEKVSELQISYPVLVDYNLETFHSYGVVAVPTTVILDARGTVRYHLPGYPLVGVEEMFRFLEAYLLDMPVAGPTVSEGHLPAPRAVRYYNLGRLMAEKKKRSSAAMYLKMAESSDENFLAPLLLLGRIYEDEGNFQDAEDQFRRALEIEPENGVALFNLGRLLTHTDRLEEALKVLGEAVQKGASYSQAHYYYGYALGLKGETEQAEEEFQKAVELNPLDYRAYYYRATIYQRSGKLKEAARLFRTALELLTGYDSDRNYVWVTF